MNDAFRAAVHRILVTMFKVSVKSRGSRPFTDFVHTFCGGPFTTLKGTRLELSKVPFTTLNVVNGVPSRYPFWGRLQLLKVPFTRFGIFKGDVYKIWDFSRGSFTGFRKI